MKVRVRWNYTFATTLTFDEVVDVGDDITDEDEACDLAQDAAFSLPNTDLTPLTTAYPDDPSDELVAITIVPADTPATLRAVPGGDPELIPTSVGPHVGSHDESLQDVDQRDNEHEHQQIHGRLLGKRVTGDDARPRAGRSRSARGPDRCR